jgi:hypothetical protein
MWSYIFSSKMQSPIILYKGLVLKRIQDWQHAEKTFDTVILDRVGVMMEFQEKLNDTRLHLLSVLDGLSNDQLNWRPNDSTWSIAQVVEHIAVVEEGTSKVISLGLEQVPSFQVTDMPLEELVLDRSKKIVAPERLHPSTAPKNLAELKAILLNSREAFLSTIGNIEDVAVLDKTSPPVAHPVFGRMSTAQWITLTPLHEERHIKQIEELKNLLAEE